MSQYRIFNDEDAITYAREAAQIGPEVILQGAEIGDGNLNQVFKVCQPGDATGLIVKQALPYIRCIGESWPLTRDRARIEAEILLQHGQFCPQHTVAVLHHDVSLSAMLLEDLSKFQVWRQALLNDQYFADAPVQLGEYLALVHFHSSDFKLDYQTQLAAQRQFANPELMSISEAVYFVDPFCDHERNDVAASIRQDAEQLWADKALKIRVAKLKHEFRCKGQALLHGDLHTGSVMVAAGKLKVIDAEFGGYGPMGFDVGVMIANLLLNFCSQPSWSQQSLRIKDVHAFWHSFNTRFFLLASQTSDSALGAPGYISAFLRQVWQDALGYAGCEMIRRTLGVAHVADIESIADPLQKTASQRQALALGRTLIMQADQINDEQLKSVAFAYRP
ncbi:S-methyl-5-thioribose kinase [Oceanisphaera pacifica]|uniref:S-methyl-5-thioribose kinase n=1 Tax=Oceanisphaera pacifica TaxID=2818389 RepID=A0ABS3NEM1_9GAMM|nr:S-methyl-5-thioribose kinase [Oceanisphaera pacifica]MBO1518731.1 S-methyl-5-thioribose kinase [Oceanisphaera pacifica]